MKSGAVEFSPNIQQQELLDAFSDRSLGSHRPRKQRDNCRTATAIQHNKRPGGEVMSLVVSGMLNKQIAAELGASEATVKMHRSQHEKDAANPC